MTLPPQMILPDTPREGIVVNLAELRLYYYPKGEDKAIVYPLGIGQLAAATPEIVTQNSQKIPNPTDTRSQHPQALRQREHYITRWVPAGPDKPMGQFAMRLARDNGQYLIHGTTAKFGIGMRVSSGFIRLSSDDIEALFSAAPKGTRVEIINQPVEYAGGVRRETLRGGAPAAVTKR